MNGFKIWWKRIGKKMALNPEVTWNMLAEAAYKAGQQNKIRLPAKRRRLNCAKRACAAQRGDLPFCASWWNRTAT